MEHWWHDTKSGQPKYSGGSEREKKTAPLSLWSPRLSSIKVRTILSYFLMCHFDIIHPVGLRVLTCITPPITTLHLQVNLTVSAATCLDF